MSQQFLDRYERVTGQLENSAANILNSALDSAYKQIESELTKRYPKIASSGSLVQSKDAIVRLEQLKNVLQLLNPEAALNLENSFERILALTNESGETLATKLTEAKGGDNWPVKPGAIAVEAAGFAARNTIEHLARYSSEFSATATAVITQGIIQGWGTAKVSSLLRNQLGVTKGKAELIARTEVLSSFNQAATAVYRNSNVEYVQIVATGDLRTCGTCVARNLKVYRIGDTSTPFHPRCRCAVMPWHPDWPKDTRWLRSFDENVRSQFTGKLNNGLSAFEKMNGLTNPPETIWQISDLGS